ncbi:ATP-dependent RNA helicase TDRD9 [Colius striatus]|uniref:ATP-dependent RNA helicase TDRD9 n=1 Tax=Colius striatus TaxID=57412 RepID=UPI002B1D23D0|nr:ATP-dependent RNA helicase TDRD9 [Colius striatus]
MKKEERLPIGESVETEYAEKYRQVEAEELNVAGNEELVYKPDNSLSQRESSWTSIPKYKCVDIPLARHKEEIVSVIESNSVVIVQGTTGCGKSTLIPQYVLDYYIEQSVYCNIAVTQPRKIGASSIAKWISMERSWTLGGIVGYQVNLEKVFTKETMLLYMTTGVLLQKIISAKSLTAFTHLFIDEVHERTEEIDFLLLVIRKLLCTNSQSVKVILMSASINCKEFIDYFTLPTHKGLNQVCVLRVEGKPYAVKEYYLDDLKHTIGFQLPPLEIKEPTIRKEMYDVAVSLIQSFDGLEMSNWKEKNLSVRTERGSVLVFLPGVCEISYMHSRLSKIRKQRWQVYPLHSSVTLEEQSNVFVASLPGYRKVILSTNIAESSVTVPDVKYVIDFCLTRILVCDEETNYGSLRLVWASKSNCNQRKGRAGRVSQGSCYRLVYKDFWTYFIPERLVPEILRCQLGTTVLKIKQLDMGSPKAVLSSALSPPRVRDIERTIRELKELGALRTCVQTDENPDDGEMTSLGRILVDLPVDLRLGKLIVLGHAFGCLEECLIIAAALSLRNFFSLSFREGFHEYRNKLFFSGDSKSDCIAIVNAFQTWQVWKQKGELKHPKEELAWGQSNGINIKKIRQVAELFHDLKKRVEAFDMCVSAQPIPLDKEHVCRQRFILQVVIAGAFYPNYFTVGKCEEQLAVRQLNGKDPKTTVMLKKMPPYGFLYHKQLQSLLRQCGEVKSIAYDGSKAFVEFSRNPTEGFKILRAVYLSVKMSQMKIPLTLDVHDITKELQGVAGAHGEFLRVNVDCLQNTVEPMETSFHTLQQLEMMPDGFMSITVTEIVEAGHFWGYRRNEKTRSALYSIAAEINSQNLMDLPVSPCPGLICLAPFTHFENRGYYRARILCVCRNVAEVFFVDYGNKSKVPLNQLRKIPSSLQELPFQALEFKMCKMRPSAVSLVCGERWSYSANKRFASLVNDCSPLVKVYSLVHGVLHVDVLCYLESEELVNIRDVLIKECYAEPAEESYESQQSRELLRDFFTNQEEEQEKFPVSSRKEEKHLIERLLKCYSDVKSDAPTQQIQLFGPYSPYEVKCSSVTRVSLLRHTLIPNESVNSLIVQDAAEVPFQQLLVAATLSVNATGNSVILWETSLMPPIPGLPALLSMLFSPAMELRVNESGKYFTGVLCGLGWSQTCRAPLLPENDMELTFDVHFGTKDISEINDIRTAINELLCECVAPSGQAIMTQLQENIRHKLLCLICKSRPQGVIIPGWFREPFVWNQVDSSRIINQPEKQHQREKDLYQLHQLVMLDA